jgi:methionine-rich copper-binding protein CopC
VTRIGTLIALACAAVLAAPAAALAHAQLDHANPAAGSTVKPAPKDVTLSFTEAVEPKFSSIEVRDAKGAAMQNGAVRRVSGNTAQLRVEVKPLPPGTYTVHWRVLSVDTHRTKGSFTFTVGP